MGLTDNFSIDVTVGNFWSSLFSTSSTCSSSTSSNPSTVAFQNIPKNKYSLKNIFLNPFSIRKSKHSKLSIPQKKTAFPVLANDAGTPLLVGTDPTARWLPSTDPTSPHAHMAALEPCDPIVNDKGEGGIGKVARDGQYLLDFKFWI